MRIGVVGAGAIALAMAAWLARQGHALRIWAPRAAPEQGGGPAMLSSSGLFDLQTEVLCEPEARGLVEDSDVVLIAVPVNAHRSVMDALLPHLRDGAVVLVSSMASLSALYLFEAARARGRDISVGSFASTVLTARRDRPMQVRIMARRSELGMSCLPHGRQPEVMELCRALFGDVFRADSDALATTLSNINPVAHVPLAIFNWTRIERAEAWPQYHYMTPRVAAVIMRLEVERQALAQACGVQVRGIEEHFARSFGTRACGLAAIAEELHAQRGGPPGPVDVATRYLAEDVPFGLVFLVALGRLFSLPMPACADMSATASLIVGQDMAAQNDLVTPLGLEGASAQSLLARVRA